MTDPELPTALSADAVAVYRRALTDGEFLPDHAAAAAGLDPDADRDALERLRDELVAHFLLQPVAPGDQRLRPVNPEVAAARLAQPFEDAIRSYRSAVEGTREQLLQLMPAYLDRTVSGPVADGFEIVPDPAEVQLLVNRAAARSTRDLMTVQPGGRRSPEQLDSSLPLDLAVARRGVRVRMIYQHTTRTQLHMRSYVSAMVEAGAEIRTADQLPDILFIIDREVAFIPKRTRPDQKPGALVVREPVLLSFLCALFEQFWTTSSPFLDEGPGYQNVSDDLKRSVLELLAQGLKDEVVARRLGMSVRSCRRHIAAVMQELGAESRFEAGVRAAELGLLKRRSVR